MDNQQNRRCDIIIPVWNNEGVTADCVESIKRNTAFPYRLVLVDNASDAGTRGYLDKLCASEKGRAVLIRNGENLGFVKAVNKGMRFSDAAYVAVMNNDTVAADGWLGEMIKVLESDPAAGLVNPSTNGPDKPSGIADIEKEAASLKGLSGRSRLAYKCSFFACVMRREIPEKIGYLDEGYGMGYFDDADYSKRVQAAGYKTVTALAAYVYHAESASFERLGGKEEIFRRNEKTFEEKWGRQLRVAYLPGKDRALSSGNINEIAVMGHHVFIFAPRDVLDKLDLIDHECARKYPVPRPFAAAMAAAKIIRRRKKKKADLVVADSRFMSFFRGAFGAEVVGERDAALKRRIEALSFGRDGGRADAGK